MTVTHVATLRRPFDALAARLALIDEATSRLDLQYYQWNSDTVGYLHLDRLLAAADRGVAVRLLVDDLKLQSRTSRVASLSLHPQIDVRMFNPWKRRRNLATEAIEFVRRFSTLDRRMHNKLFIADGQRAIAGGRNIADEHFGLNKSFNFVDFDVLVSGAGVLDLEDVFETYWNSPPVVPASALDESVTGSDLEAVRSFVSEEITARGNTIPSDLTTDTAWRDRVAATTLRVAENALHVTCDTPAVTSATQRTQVIGALQEAIDGARHELVAVAPFFIPSEMDTAWYQRLVDRGVRLRLLTNSLASNPGTISNSGLNRRRKDVLRAGVDLREFRADAAVKPESEIAPNVGGYLGLHAKLYAIDGEKVFLGSVNLDPRSKYVNTEVGMLIENADFARNTVEGIERVLTPANAWRVGLGADDRLTWTNDAETTYRQPARSRGQRIADRIYEMLPINPYI